MSKNVIKATGSYLIGFVLAFVIGALLWGAGAVSSQDTPVFRASIDTLTNKTISAPVLSGSVTGTYTLAGTPSLSSPVITAPSIVTSIAPSTAGGFNVGTAALPFSGIFIGSAATNNIRVTGTSAAARVYTLPDVAEDTSFVFLAGAQSIAGQKTFVAPILGAATGTSLSLSGTTSLLLGTAGSLVGDIGFKNATSGTVTLAPVTGALGTVTISLPAAAGTVPLATFTNCMTGGATCSPTTVSSSARVIHGVSGALNGASPSVAAVTLSPAFTSSTSYVCTVTPHGATAAIAAGGVAIVYTSSSVITLTAANSATHALSYVCVGI